MKPAILARTVVLGAVLLGAGTAHAGTLYRWSEPDGALTFSPTPPQDGTPYEEVDPMTMRPRAEAGEPRSSGGRSAVSDATPAVSVPRTPVAGTLAAEAPESPPLGAAANREAVPRTAIRAAEATHEPTVAAAATNASDGDGRDVVASSDKDERCEELQKRVISLERRLATPLTPLDMDNTVVYMARYQQNYERYCRR